MGYGLEGALPDAKTGRIQDNSMIPFFRDGGYGIGIYSGFLAIVKEVYAEYGIEYEPAGYNYYNDGKYAESDSDAGGVLLFIFVLILVIIDLVFFKGRLTRFLIISSGSRHYRSHSGGFTAAEEAAAEEASRAAAEEAAEAAAQENGKNILLKYRLYLHYKLKTAYI